MQFIHLVEGAYSKESCNHLIDFFETNINLAVPGNAGDKKLNNLEIGIDFKNTDNSELLKKLYDNVLINMLFEYVEKFPLIDSVLGQWAVTSTCQFAKFESNNYYSHIHCEHGKRYPNRILAWMMYLNDIKDGGGTYFHHQNFTTNPVAGNLYIWPAGWTHMHVGVNAPYESKYTITGWVGYK